MDHAAGVKPRLPRRLRLFRQRAVTLHRQQRHPPPRGLCQTRNDISVAAVVAMSAEDQPVRAGRISTAGQLERRLARALHEFEQRQPRAVRRLSFGQRSASAGQMLYGILSGFFVIVWSIMSQPLDLVQLAQQIKQWGTELGFQQVGIADTDLSASEPKLQAWLDKQYHGEMEWMARHGMMRARPHELLPGTLRVISVRMNYLPANAAFARTLKDPTLGYVSRYALGRDYHKLLRNRLKSWGEDSGTVCFAQF